MPLVPAHLRRPAALTAVVCWVLVALLGAWYAGDQVAGGLDGAIADGVHRAIGEQTFTARLLTGPSHPIVSYPVIAFTVGVAVFRRWWARAVLAVAAPALCVLFTEVVVKPLVDRTYAGVLSYPSGHTVSAMATLGVAALVVTVDWPAAARRTVLGLLVVVWAVLAIGLVGMDYHYFTDTVGGFLLAIGVVAPLAMAADRVSVVSGTVPV
jgi:membrane-associated phospholipid phosphatase